MNAKNLLLTKLVQMLLPQCVAAEEGEIYIMCTRVLEAFPDEVGGADPWAAVAEVQRRQLGWKKAA